MRGLAMAIVMEVVYRRYFHLRIDTRRLALTHPSFKALCWQASLLAWQEVKK